ncbi:MAG: hypothetical protein EBE86_019355 [Hormoscilla sp. GUM202]|nr:hypothetical protein [Hormoscilla sp. GUM202]
MTSPFREAAKPQSFYQPVLTAPLRGGDISLDAKEVWVESGMYAQQKTVEEIASEKGGAIGIQYRAAKIRQSSGLDS